MAVPAENNTKVNLSEVKVEDFCHFPDSREKTGKPHTHAPTS